MLLASADKLALSRAEVEGSMKAEALVALIAKQKRNIAEAVAVDKYRIFPSFS
jgi:hypothetical protein